MADESTTTELADKWMKILRVIECPACLEYMDQDILLCRNGHSVCKTCRQVLQKCPMCRATFSNIKNYNLMYLAEALEYPCKHMPFGCKQFNPKNAMVEHEVACAFRPYPCRIRGADGKQCTWSGVLADVYAHAVGHHPQCAWMLQENIDRWKAGHDLDNEVQIAKAHGKLFYFTRRIVKDVMHWSLNIIGPNQDADEFVLQLQFTRGRGPLGSLQWLEKCRPFDATAVDVEDFGLNTAFVKKLQKDSNIGMWYKVNILKKEDLDESDVYAEETLLYRG